MKYKKGQSGNPSGRKPGTKNKIPGDLREKLSSFLENGFEDFLIDYSKLPAHERIKTFRLCLQYVLPKMNAIDINQGQEPIGEIIITSVREKLVKKLTEAAKENENETDN